MREALGNDAPSRDQVNVIIKTVDVDNSGTIDFGEFMMLMSDPKFNELAKDERRQAFDMFDKDGNGYISVTELKEAFRGLGEFPPNPSHQKFSSSDARFLLGQRLSDEEFNSILKEADLDGDQRIDYEEFLQVRSDPRPLLHESSRSCVVIRCYSVKL